jgi:hypothetical protein
MNIQTNKKKRGLTVVELLVGSCLALMVMALLVQVTMLSSVTFEKLQTQGSSLNKGRANFEKVVDDIKLGDRLLVSYPPTRNLESYQFQALDNRVLIIRQPKYPVIAPDAPAIDPAVSPTRDPIPDENVIVIYSIDEATDPKDGPYVLKRYVGHFANNTYDTARFDKVMLTNISNPEIATAINLQFVGNGSTRVFYTLSPMLDPLPKVPNSVMVGKQELGSQGLATIANQIRNRIIRNSDGTTSIVGSTRRGMVIMNQPPNNGLIIDVYYHADPTFSVDLLGDNGGTAVYLKFTFTPKWRGAGGVERERSIHFSSRTILQNRDN